MLVTDRARVAPRAADTARQLERLEELVAAAVDAGIDVVQIRERDLEAGALMAFTSRVVRLARGRARVVVNDRADVALLAGADGVHLRSDGPDARRVRALANRPFTISRSVHSVEEAIANPDADWLLCGSVFATASHPGQPPAGTDLLRAVCAATRVPVWAIGGVEPGRIADCLAAGAVGVAAIGAFLPPEPGGDLAAFVGDAVCRFREALETGREAG